MICPYCKGFCFTDAFTAHIPFGRREKAYQVVCACGMRGPVSKDKELAEKCYTEGIEVFNINKQTPPIR